MGTKTTTGGKTGPLEALDRAIAAAGTVTALARLIGVTSNTPTMWRARGAVPAEHCPAIERETGVFCEDLCPSVPWDAVRGRPRPEQDADGASGVASDRVRRARERVHTHTLAAIRQMRDACDRADRVVKSDGDDAPLAVLRCFAWGLAEATGTIETAQREWAQHQRIA